MFHNSKTKDKFDKENMDIYLLLIYDKKQADNFNPAALKAVLKEIGLL